MAGQGERSLRRTGQAHRTGATDARWSRNEKREILAQVRMFDLFDQCSKSDLEALIDVSGRFAVPAGWPLMLETTPADACFAITSGEAAVFRGRERIATLSAGHVVGEMAVLTGTLRRATVTSTTPLRGLRVDNEALERLFAQRPALLTAMRYQYEQRVRVSPKVRLRESLRSAFTPPMPLPETV
jgi:CRP/FNR family cyclic AMP-dependent transcriptional regulator